jgi:hypothetical protein
MKIEKATDGKNTMKGVTSSAALLIGARCKYCGHTRPFGEVRGDEPEGYTCLNCLDWHCHALKMLAGEIPRGCQVCGVTFRQLSARSLADVKMVLLMKDGIYQVLCKACEGHYAPRCGFFRGTLYEKLKKLAGYK